MTRPAQPRPIERGPDFSVAGLPVDWTSDVALDERFTHPIAAAFDRFGEDVYLMRWEHDDPLADQYAKWWNDQLPAIRKEARRIAGDRSVRVTATRRLDKGDGWMKCYVRVQHRRPKLEAVEAAS
jgi:hypothetical protein